MFFWIKALHVIAVISWMAGLLYLPRLMVYHSAAPAGSELSATFKVMEGRLYRYIMQPAMIVTWLTGLTIAWLGGYWTDYWLWAKLALVVALTGFHETAGRWIREFSEDRNARDARFYRIANEVPTVLMIGIVILVIVKPF